MTFSQLMKSYFGFLLQLSARVLTLRPFDFFYVVFLVTVNQISFILAAFLPIKILIMLGSEGVPRYLTFLIAPEEKDRWIIILVGLAAGFYLLYSLTEYLINQRGKSVAQKVMRTADKVDLFEKQENFISDAFLRVAQTWSGYGIFLAGFALGFWLDWRVFGLLSIALILEIVSVGLLWRYLQGIEHVDSRLALIDKRATVVNLCSGLNFLVAFGALFYLFFVGQIDNFIVAIIMVLIARQTMTRLKIAVMSGFFLLSNQEKIRAVFYEQEQYQERVDNLEKHFIESLLPENRQVLLSSCGNAIGLDLNGYRWTWFDSGQKNIACFVSEEESEQRLFLKIYANNQKVAFQNESYLLSALQSKLPLMPELLTSADVGGVAVALFKLPMLEKVQKLPDAAKAIKQQLFEFEVDKDVVDRFSRAKTSVADRLDPSLVQQLRISPQADLEKVNALAELLPELSDIVRLQPKRLANPLLNATTVGETAKEQLVVLFWHRASIEPAPCLFNINDYKKLDGATIGGQLTLKLQQFDNLIRQQQYDNAYKQVEPILALHAEYMQEHGTDDD